MSMFNTILSKLGVGGRSSAPPPAPPRAPSASTPSASAPSASAPSASAPSASAPSQTPPTSARPQDAAVDVTALLEQRAAASSQKLNWRTSIVDLLKLLDMDSSLAARKELAQELGCPADLMGDSAQMNMWLHKTVLKRVADNGGKVPKELLN